MSVRRAFALLAAFAVWLCVGGLVAAQTSQDDDKVLLGKAIEYFQSNKFHEASLLFYKLSRNHTLSPRLIAYLGVCCYYDADYKLAAKYLDQTVERLEAFAPQERSVYYFCDAESHYRLAQYALAVSFYERYLVVCHDNERAEALYKLGLCYYEMLNWSAACEYLNAALACFEQGNGDEIVSKKMQNIRELLTTCDKNAQHGTAFAD